jgi:hypothetical protein
LLWFWILPQTLFELPNTWTSFGYGFYFRLFLLCCVDEVDGFNAPAAPATFVSNMDFEQEEAGTVHVRLKAVGN